MTLIAIGLVVIASVCFALGATGQHLAIHRNQADTGKQAMTPRELLSLLRNPRWLGSTVLIGCGAALHIVALKLAPVTVVQPVGILAVAWSVLLAGRIHGYRAGRVIWTAVGMTVVGIVAFTVLSATYSEDKLGFQLTPVVVATVIIYVVGGVLAAASRWVPLAFRCLLLASAGAVLYGLASALTKTLLGWVGEHGWLSPQVIGALLAIIATYVIGGWMIQQAYAVGHAEIVVGSLTVIDPVVAVLFGLVVLGEGEAITALVALGMLLAGGLATVGVVLLSRYHPEARERSAVEVPA